MVHFYFSGRASLTSAPPTPHVPYEAPGHVDNGASD